MTEIQVLTVENAKEVKEILDTIKEVLPAQLIDYVFVHYKWYINPTMGKPCSGCSGKPWANMIKELRELVDKTIATEEPVILEDDNEN